VTAENRARNAREELERAETCLQEARALHAAAFPYGAVSRAYYAVFHASRALLFSIGLETRSHIERRDAIRGDRRSSALRHDPRHAGGLGCLPEWRALSHDHPSRRTPDAVDDARRQLARVDEEVRTRAPGPRESSPRPADHNPVTNVWRDHAANVFELFVLDADGDVAATFARLQWKVEEVLDRVRLLLPSSPA